jgi:hypothetical protein
MFTFSQTYLYQTIERALPGNLQNVRGKVFLASPNVVSLTDAPFSLLPLSLSLSLFKLK